MFRTIQFLIFLVFQFSIAVQAQNNPLLKGKILAESYCSTCHSYAPPSLLPKEIWKNKVLPQMAALMGFKEVQDSLGVWDNKSDEEIAIIKRLGIYPPTKQISVADFQAIMDFYNAEAPTILPPQKLKDIPEVLQSFTPKTLFIDGIKSPKTSLVAINEERGEVFISDASTNQLYVKVQNDELFTLPDISSPVVQFIKKAPNVYNFVTIGSIAPSDLSQGALYEMDLNLNAWNQASHPFQYLPKSRKQVSISDLFTGFGKILKRMGSLILSSATMGIMEGIFPFIWTGI